MKQLSMTMHLEQVKPYPLHEDYYFRNLRPDSQEDITAWEAVCQHGLEGYNDYREAILGIPGICPETDIFFACDKATDKPVATLTAYIDPTGMGRIHMVAAISEVRGKKIGHAMLAHGLAHLQAMGAKEVSLTTDDFRRAAIKNYLTAGFQPEMIPDDSPDAIPMEQRWEVILREMQAYR